MHQHANTLLGVAAWDRKAEKAQAKARDAAIAAHLADVIGPFSPYWREALKALGLRGRDVTDLTGLQRIPATGERDVCPDGDPAGTAALICRADESGWALHAPGHQLRRGLGRRLRGNAAFRRQVEAAVRPTSYHFGGVGMTFPVASTRDDLDLIARAGARMWGVLGLTNADVLVSAVPVQTRLEHVALTYAALGAGAPALYPGGDPDAVADTLGLVPATVLALPARGAAAILDEIGELPGTVTTLLLVGGPTPGERADVAELAGTRRVLGVWGPPDGRVLYAEAEPGGGYVSYPDLEVLEVIDPDTGIASAEGGELVLTQLGFRGTSLVRWRTGTLVDGRLLHSTQRGRTVPRIPSSLQAGALVPSVILPGGETAIDLRALSARLTRRTDLSAFRVDLTTNPRTGVGQLIVVITPRPGSDPAAASTGVAADTRAATGSRVTQVVVDSSLV